MHQIMDKIRQDLRAGKRLEESTVAGLSSEDINRFAESRTQIS